jgi:hypothetical protein
VAGARKAGGGAAHSKCPATSYKAEANLCLTRAAGNQGYSSPNEGRCQRLPSLGPPYLVQCWCGSRLGVFVNQCFLSKKKARTPQTPASQQPPALCWRLMPMFNSHAPIIQCRLQSSMLQQASQQGQQARLSKLKRARTGSNTVWTANAPPAAIRYQRDQTEQGIDEIQWTVEWRSLKPKGRVKGRMITGCAIRHAGGGGRAVVQKGLMRTTKGMPLEKARGACTHVPKGQGFVAKAFLLFVVETGRPENRTAALRACAVGRGRGRLGRMAGKHIRSHAADNEKACCPCHLPEGTACRRRAT